MELIVCGCVQMLKPLFYRLTDVMSTVAGGIATVADVVLLELLVIVVL